MAHVPAITRSANPLVHLVFAATRLTVGRVIGPVRGYAHSVRTLVGMSLGHLCFDRPAALPPALSALVHVRVASLVQCPFCIDIGSELATQAGVDTAKLLALVDWRESPLFSAEERLALAWADRLTATPVAPDDALVEAVTAHFTPRQLVVLTSAVAFENQRARLNHGLGYGAEGFANQVCAIPATVGPPSPA